jgi:hypothetical protein
MDQDVNRGIGGIPVPRPTPWPRRTLRLHRRVEQFRCLRFLVWSAFEDCVMVSDASQKRRADATLLRSVANHYTFLKNALVSSFFRSQKTGPESYLHPSPSKKNFAIWHVCHVTSRETVSPQHIGVRICLSASGRRDLLARSASDGFRRTRRWRSGLVGKKLGPPRKRENQTKRFLAQLHVVPFRGSPACRARATLPPLPAAD